MLVRLEDVPALRLDFELGGNCFIEPTSETVDGEVVYARRDPTAILAVVPCTPHSVAGPRAGGATPA